MIVTLPDLPNLRKKHKAAKIVVASGVFDLLHLGHIEYLSSLKNYGDINVVIVKPDARIKRFKHPNRPIIPERDRARMVDAIKGVDYVIIGPDTTAVTSKIDPMYEEVFAALQPDAYVSSNDVWEKLAEITDAEVHMLPREKVGRFDSTTSIINYIHNLDSF